MAAALQQRWRLRARSAADASPFFLPPVRRLHVIQRAQPNYAKTTAFTYSQLHGRILSHLSLDALVDRGHGASQRDDARHRPEQRAAKVYELQ